MIPLTNYDYREGYMFRDVFLLWSFWVPHLQCQEASQQCSPSISCGMFGLLGGYIYINQLGLFFPIYGKNTKCSKPPTYVYIYIFWAKNIVQYVDTKDHALYGKIVWGLKPFLTNLSWGSIDPCCWVKQTKLQKGLNRTSTQKYMSVPRFSQTLQIWWL